MSPSNKSIPLLKVVLLYPLIMPIVAVVSLLFQGWDCLAFLITFALTYPLWCFGICCVKFYEEYLIVVQPFCMFRTRMIKYDQIEYVKETTYGKYTVNLSPWDLYVYVKGKKEPIGIPMPWSSQKQKKMKNLIESKGIPVEWGMYG